MIQHRRFSRVHLNFFSLSFILFLLAPAWDIAATASAASANASAEAAQRSRRRARARRPPSASPAKNVVPARPLSAHLYSLNGTGLEPHRNLALADPVMSQLRTAARNFLESPSPIHRQELRRFAERYRSHQAAALAYLALGYSALLGKDYGDAAGLLRAGRQITSPVPDYLDYYLALALQKLGQHREAIEVINGFEQRYPFSSLMGSAVLARAESMIAGGQTTAAAELLKARLGALKRPEADLLLGRAYAAAESLADAVEAYRQAYYLYPGTEEAEEAVREIARLSKLLKAGGVPASPALRRERAERLFAARRFRAAQEAYSELAEAESGPERDQAVVRSAAAQFRAGGTAAAYKTLAALRPAGAAAEAERLYYLGECYRRMKRESEFLETVRRLGEKHAASPWYEEALFSAGNYFFLKRDARSAEYYRTLDRQFPGGQYAPVAHWRVAWSHYRGGDSDEARRLLEEQVVRFPQTPHVAAALYWLGRLAEQRDPAVAVAYFRKAGESFPQYFYGTLAQQKLGETRVVPGAAPAAALPDNVTRVLAAVPVYRPALAGIAPPADLAGHRRKVEALEAAWLLDLAVIELRHATDDLTHSQYLLLELARLERDRGRFLAAIEYIRRVFPNYFAFPVAELDRGVWELLFPLPWWPEVQAYSTQHGLDPYLVAALIRQESAFNRWAISRARAYGLMQLLPSTARILARKLGRPSPSIASLFDVDTNLELGTKYLYDVLQRNDGRLRLEAALASYNAGPNRVDAWLAQGDFGDAPEFIESIPITETREYVQAVLRNAAIYRRLYAGK